jgi:hypothetical protein
VLQTMPGTGRDRSGSSRDHSERIRPVTKLRQPSPIRIRAPSIDRASSPVPLPASIDRASSPVALPGVQITVHEIPKAPQTGAPSCCVCSVVFLSQQHGDVGACFQHSIQGTWTIADTQKFHCVVEETDNGGAEHLDMQMQEVRVQVLGQTCTNTFLNSM